MTAQKCIILVAFVLAILPNANGQFDKLMEKANPMVQFIRELSGPQAKEYIKMTTNPDVSRAQLGEQLKAFAEENGIEEAYQKLEDKVAEAKGQMAEAAPQNLAGPALETYSRIAVSAKGPNQSKRPTVKRSTH
jgi:hypothetical protein